MRCDPSLLRTLARGLFVSHLPSSFLLSISFEDRNSTESGKVDRTCFVYDGDTTNTKLNSRRYVKDLKWPRKNLAPRCLVHPLKPVKEQRRKGDDLYFVTSLRPYSHAGWVSRDAQRRKTGFDTFPRQMQRRKMDGTDSNTYSR